MNRLNEILMQKQREILALKRFLKKYPAHKIQQLLDAPDQASMICPKKTVKSFKKALQSHPCSVIAEIKRHSPSKGFLAPIPDPVSLAKIYQQGGAQALSILTDKRFFKGHLNDLTNVANALQQDTIPLLRKDFILDKVQIAHAALAGADAVLCIIAATGEKTASLIRYAKQLNLDVLVEIHDESELSVALAAGADIIGINNRNLSTFNVNPHQALTMAASLPDPVIKIAESGINDPAWAHRYFEAGFHAVLIGEALVKSENPAAFIKACQMPC